MRIRVVYILHATVMGGATISFLNLVRELKKKGVEIVVIIPKHDIIFENHIKEIGGKCYIAPVVVSTYPKLEKKGGWQTLSYIKTLVSFHLKKIKSLWIINKIISLEYPSIVHTNVGVVHEGLIAARLHKIPHVWHLREYQDKDFDLFIYPSKKYYQRLLRRSYVITITDDIRCHFQLRGYIKARTIYNGIMPLSSVCYQYPKEHFFLCASRISPEKGHDETIKVFAKFLREKPDYRLIMLGFGEETYLKQLKDLSESLGCSESIEWVGFTNDVTSYMKRALALIVNSKFEGFGRMTAEACFCGCLVIGKNTGGTKEILDYTGGYCINNDDELLSAMKDIAGLSMESYEIKAKIAQEKASSAYSIEKNAENIFQFYHEIVAD